MNYFILFDMKNDSKNGSCLTIIETVKYVNLRKSVLSLKYLISNTQSKQILIKINKI